jgi:hypothetical protein
MVCDAERTTDGATGVTTDCGAIHVAVGPPVTSINEWHGGRDENACPRASAEPAVVDIILASLLRNPRAPTPEEERLWLICEDCGRSLADDLRQWRR